MQDVYPEKDGLVWKAKIELGDRGRDINGKRTMDATVLERPIHKLVLLVAAEEEKDWGFSNEEL